MDQAEPGARPPWRWLGFTAASVAAVGVSSLGADPGVPRSMALLGLALVAVMASRLPLVAATLAALGLTVATATGPMPIATVVAAIAVSALVGAAPGRRTWFIGPLVILLGGVVAVALDPRITVGGGAMSLGLLVGAAAIARAMRITTARRVAHGRLRAELALAGARSALARDIHDVAGHALVAMITQIRLVRLALAKADPDRAGQKLHAAEAAAREALIELRELASWVASGVVAATPITQVAEVVAQIRQAANHYDGAVVDAELTHTGLRAEVGATAVRIAQQCLANAGLHAPGRPVTLRIREDVLQLRLTCENPIGDRAGSSPASEPGAGVAIMKARVAEVGGTLAIRADDGTFQVVCALPLTA